MKITDKKSVDEARETIIELQRWLSQYSREDKDVNDLVIHLDRSRTSLERIYFSK